ncbi:MAG: sigma-70 family RNA polymerase sigma factor [Oscillospiraceae bacterium]|nr:sigma-70 family RNA polymerase sigma factor [Oscillospiraceae bacterium]
MKEEHRIVSLVQAARQDMRKADELIRAYLPFIRSEAAKFLARICTDQDDEYSIAMIAFYEAINNYNKERGSFLNYAAMLIRSRLIDYQRKEARHQGHLSLDEPSGEEDDRSLMDSIADHRDLIGEASNLEATEQEIRELGEVMKGFGVSFTDVSANAPRQDRTMEACGKAIRYAAAHKEILDELLRTKKLPLARLALGSGVERKTLERHRKYILVMLLILTNGYEIIRGHLYHVLRKKGGGSA